MAGHAPPKRLRISELNPHLLCALCGGYLIDATTIIECLHSFCKTCILRYLETSNYCPICEVLIHKTRPWQNIRLDHALQNAVYKTVPGLFQNEMQRRREFYQKQNKDRRVGRVSSSSKERDGRVTAATTATSAGTHSDCCSHGQLGDRVIFSKDEKFSISIEFSPDGKPVEDVVKKNSKRQKNIFPQDKRYLHCPAGLRIEHLKKFIRAKFSLPEDIQIDLFYERDPLCDTYSLMDVAYICMWKRDCVLRLFYSFYEVPHKVPRLDTSAVKLEMEKVMKDGQKELGDGNEEKANHVKTEEEKQQKKRAITDKKSRTQKDEKHQKVNEEVQENSTAAKVEMDTTSEDKVKDCPMKSDVKIDCSPALTLKQGKIAEDMEVKVVLEKTLAPEQEKIAVTKNNLCTKLNHVPKSEVKDQENSLDSKSNLTSNTGHNQEVKTELSNSIPSIGRGAVAGMKRKLTENDETDSNQSPGSSSRQASSSVSKPVQGCLHSSQKDTNLIPKTVQDIKQKLTISLSDLKGSVPKYSKPTPPSNDVKPLPMCNMKKLQVNLIDTKMSPTVEISKFPCSSHNIKPSTVGFQAMKSVANQAIPKATTASQSMTTVSSPQILQSVTVALDKKSVSTSQIVKSSPSVDIKPHSGQKSKSLGSHKDAKVLKDSKASIPLKETHSSPSVKETKSSPNGKEPKPPVKYAHQSQQTVSYTIVSCGVNGDNSKFPPGPNSPKAPLKMLIKSSESKDSKTCFIASTPLDINKGTKYKEVSSSKAKTSPKDFKSSPTKTSVGTSTKSMPSKQKQPKEKKSKHSETKNSWKPKKTSPKSSSLSNEQHISHKTEKKSMLESPEKPTSSQSILKNAQDVYSFVPEEKEDMPPKLKEVLKINPAKASVVKLPVNTKEAHSATVSCVFPPAIASHTLEPEQSEAVNLSQKRPISDGNVAEISKSSSPKSLCVNGKIPTSSNHFQTKVAASSLSHSNVDNNYTYMYAIDLSKAKTPSSKAEESLANTNSTNSIAASKISTTLNSQTNPESQQEIVTSQVENLSCPDTSIKMFTKPQLSLTDAEAAAKLIPRDAHKQVIIPNKSAAKQMKVSNSLAMVVANLASNAVSNLVTSIKLASSKASSTESSSLDQPSTTTTTEPHIFQVKAPVSDMKSTSIRTTSQVPTTTTPRATTETVFTKNSMDSSAPVANITELEGNKKDQTSPDSTVSLQAPVSTTQTEQPSERSVETHSEVSSSKVSESKPSSSPSDISKTIITVPLLPSQANIFSLKGTSAQAEDVHEKTSHEKEDLATSHVTESSPALSVVELETSAIVSTDSTGPPTVSISSVTSCDSPTTVSISLSPNSGFPTNTTTAPVSNNNSSTIISISLPVTSIMKSTSVTTVTSASSFFSSAAAAPLKPTDSVTSTLMKQNSTQPITTVTEEKTFLNTTSRKQSLSKGFDSPGKKLEASVSKLLLPKDPRKIDNFLFDTVPGERESPTSTSSPKPKDILLGGAEEPQSSSFMEDTIISVARGTLPEVSESASSEKSETPFTAIHQLPKTISQTSKAHAARKSSPLVPNHTSTLPAHNSNKNVIQTTKISTLIPKSSSATSKSSMYAKAFPYPALNAIPASRAFLHAAFPHAAIMHPDFTAMVNGTNNFVRSLIAAQQHASRPVIPQFHSRPLGTSYHLPPKASVPSSTPRSHVLPKCASTHGNKSTHDLSSKLQPVPKSLAVSVSSKSSPASTTPKSTTSQEQVASSISSESSGADNHKSTLPSSSHASGYNQNNKEGKSIKLRAMPPLTIPKSNLGGTTLKLQRSPGSTGHYVLSPTSGSVKSNTSYSSHSHSGERSKSLKEGKRSSSVGSSGSRTPTSPLSPKDSSLAGERQRVPTIKISDINRNPIIVDNNGGGSGNTTLPTPQTTNTTKAKPSSNNNHSHNHRSTSASSSSPRPPSASSTSSLSPSSVAQSSNNNNNIPSPNSSGANQRTSSRSGERGSDSSCSPTGSAPERSPARDSRRPPSTELLLPHHQRWHGFPTAELLFHGFKLPAHAHFQELHYDTDAMPLDYSQSSSKS